MDSFREVLEMMAYILGVFLLIGFFTIISSPTDSIEAIAELYQTGMVAFTNGSQR